MQADAISNTSYHGNILWRRYLSLKRVFGLQAHEVRAWEARAAGLDYREAQKEKVEAEHALQVKLMLYRIATLTVTLRPSQVKLLQIDLDAQKSAADQTARIQNAKNQLTDSTLGEVLATMHGFKARLDKVEAENKDLRTESKDLRTEITGINIKHALELTELRLIISALQEEVGDLVKYQETTVGVPCSLFPVAIADPKL